MTTSVIVDEMHSDTYRREGVHHVSPRSVVVLVCVNVSRQRG